MPQGKGTYGSKKGRPPKKKNKNRDKAFGGGFFKMLKELLKKHKDLEFMDPASDDASPVTGSRYKPKIHHLSNRRHYQKGSEVVDNEVVDNEMNNQMDDLMGEPTDEEIEQSQIPDEEMEDDYTNFIMDEALTEDEKYMLMSKLEQDEELAMLFDKVIDVAQEFAGSGPVEGPGSGISDSIPARLSDGEFVFNAKATSEIGPDNLDFIMGEAEKAADERQRAYSGGIQNKGEEEVLSSASKRDRVPRPPMEEDTTTRDRIRENQLNPLTQGRHIVS